MIANNIKLRANREVHPKREDISASPVAPIILRDTLRGVKMKQIKLTQGKVALVDDTDYKWLNQWKWCIEKGRSTIYAMRNVGQKPCRTTLTMHRIIMQAQKGRGVDHIDGDGLNNQRSNLRFCTQSQNMMNQFKRKNCTSKYKGVFWNKRERKWIVVITKQGRKLWLGRYDSEIEAAKIYDAKAKELYGEFARLNFPEKVVKCG